MRVKSYRGAQVAAGAVVLAVLVVVLDVRFDGDWGDGAHLAYTAAAAAFVLWLGLGSAMEIVPPRPYQTALYVSGFVLALATLVRLADVLGASTSSAGTITWIAAALTVLASVLAAWRRSPTGTLLAGVSATTAAVALAEWAADPSAQAIRWILLAVVVAGVLLALEHRDRRRGHAVQLVNVAGLALAAIAASGLTLGLGDGGEAIATFAPRIDLGWGWQLLLFGGGCGLLAFGGVEYVRGPAVIGVAVLGAFVAATASGGFLGWPLALGVIAAAMLVIGLRPSTPLPPPPLDAEPEADVRPLR